MWIYVYTSIGQINILSNLLYFLKRNCWMLQSQPLVQMIFKETYQYTLSNNNGFHFFSPQPWFCGNDNLPRGLRLSICLKHCCVWPEPNYSLISTSHTWAWILFWNDQSKRYWAVKFPQPCYKLASRYGCLYFGCRKHYSLLV